MISQAGQSQVVDVHTRILKPAGFDWQTDDHWLRLAFLLLLADGVWGTLWAALGSTDWAAHIAQWRQWGTSEQPVALPYTRPGTPGYRLSRWLAQLRCWWRQDLWPGCGHAVSAIVVAVPLGAAISAFLGPEFLLLSLGALAVMQLVEQGVLELDREAGI